MSSILGTVEAQNENQFEHQPAYSSQPSYMQPPVTAKAATPVIPTRQQYVPQAAPQQEYQPPQYEDAQNQHLLEDQEYEREYYRQLALMEMQEQQAKTKHTSIYPEGMGMPGIRAEYNPNPYMEKARGHEDAQPRGGKPASKGSKVYDLGPSAIRGGIFGPPDISAASRTGKAVRYNPASGTYAKERPF